MTRTLLATPLANVTIERQEWAVRELMPLGALTILAGTAGIAKSTILAWYVARLTRGELDGDLKGTPTGVAIIAGEDDISRMLVPRLSAAGADLDRVTAVDGVRVSEEGRDWITSPNLADDLEALRGMLIQLDCRVLIIDPIISMMRGDTYRPEDVRRNLDPLANMATELGIAVVGVMHFNKGSGRAGEKVSGSHAFRDIARSLLVLAVDEETDNRILTVEKSNYSPARPSLAFRVDSVSIPTTHGESTTVARAELLGESSITVHDILARDESNLASLTKRLLAFVAANPDGVTAEAVADHLECTKEKARTYLNRQVNAERIARGHERGVFVPVSDTAHNNAPPVMSVSNVMSSSTLDTHVTHGVSVSKPYCTHGITTGARCSRCGGSAVAA